MVISTLISMIRNCIKYSGKRGSANDVPLLPKIETIFSSLLPHNYMCSILTYKIMTEKKSREEKVKQMPGRIKEKVRDCFHEVEWEFRVRLE